MFLRGQQVNGVRLIVDIVFFLCGLGVLVVAIHLWSGCGFTLTFPHHRGAPAPCGFARWLTLVGIIVAAYFGFSLASTFVHSDPNDEDDDTPNI